MNQFIDENCNSSFINSFLQMNQFICFSQINPNELNANSFMNGNGPCTSWNTVVLCIEVANVHKMELSIGPSKMPKGWLIRIEGKERETAAGGRRSETELS